MKVNSEEHPPGGGPTEDIPPLVLDGEGIQMAEVKRGPGGDQIHFWQAPDIVHAVAPEAISTWSELLGYAEPTEALAAILDAATNDREPAEHPETGENAWTDAFTLLSIRERAREEEAARAIEEGKQNDPRSPRLRSTLAAYNAVHVPIDDGECLMDRCRRVARDRMGLPEPSRKCGADSRNLDPILATSAMAPPNADWEKLDGVVRAVGDKLAENTREFLHELSGSQGEDPLSPPPEQKGESFLETTEDLYGRYVEGSGPPQDHLSDEGYNAETNEITRLKLGELSIPQEQEPGGDS